MERDTDMKKSFVVAALLLTASGAVAADEAALKEQMKKECAPLFAEGAACSNLAKGTRKCVRQNLSQAGASCVAFEKANKSFFDAGMKDDIVKK